MTGRPVDDQAIMAALEELLRNPGLGDDPYRHLDLAGSGYILLDAPHPEGD